MWQGHPAVPRPCFHRCSGSQLQISNRKKQMNHSRWAQKRREGRTESNGCTSRCDKILIRTFSVTRFQLIKCYANHTQCRMYPPRLLVSFSLSVSLGCGPWEVQVQTRELCSPSGSVLGLEPWLSWRWQISGRLLISIQYIQQAPGLLGWQH